MHSKQPSSRSAKLRSCIVGSALLLGSVVPAWFVFAEERPTLCDRLGGPAFLAQVADELVEVSRADPVSAHHFAKVNLKRLKQQIGIQLCAVSGGPCVYDGDDMKSVHAGQNINEADFYRLVEHLRAILDAHGVGTREKNELLARLAPMKRDVVTK
jgi:hemoglobin